MFNRTMMASSILAIAIVVAASVSVFLAFEWSSESVSAEELCQEMKDSSVTDDNPGAPFTEDQYLKIRDKFKNVDDEDLSTSGVKLVDAVWQVSQLRDGEEMGALAYMDQLTEGMSGVTGACAEHGVVLNVMAN